MHAQLRETIPWGSAEIHGWKALPCLFISQKEVQTREAMGRERVTDDATGRVQPGRTCKIAATSQPVDVPPKTVSLWILGC